jgi:natural product precursor
MKKEIKKLSLGKKTISNLKPSEMRKLVGAGHGGHSCHCYEAIQKLHPNQTHVQVTPPVHNY